MWNFRRTAYFWHLERWCHLFGMLAYLNLYWSELCSIALYFVSYWLSMSMTTMTTKTTTMMIVIAFDYDCCKLVTAKRMLSFESMVVRWILQLMNIYFVSARREREKEDIKLVIWTTTEKHLCTVPVWIVFNKPINGWIHQQFGWHGTLSQYGNIIFLFLQSLFHHIQITDD